MWKIYLRVLRRGSNRDADLIAKVVSGASEEITNKVVAEVTKNSTDDKISLSAKVMKSIIDVNPDKIENLSDENNELINGKIIQKTKGGVIVEHTETGSLMFCPGSQISDKPVKNNKQNATNANHLPAEKKEITAKPAKT